MLNINVVKCFVHMLIVNFTIFKYVMFKKKKKRLTFIYLYIYLYLILLAFLKNKESLF